jgi:hypothetical protein
MRFTLTPQRGLPGPPEPTIQVAGEGIPEGEHPFAGPISREVGRSGRLNDPSKGGSTANQPTGAAKPARRRFRRQTLQMSLTRYTRRAQHQDRGCDGRWRVRGARGSGRCRGRTRPPGGMGARGMGARGMGARGLGSRRVGMATSSPQVGATWVRIAAVSSPATAP